jgi:hypothetical protein
MLNYAGLAKIEKSAGELKGYSTFFDEFCLIMNSYIVLREGQGTGFAIYYFRFIIYYFEKLGKNIDGRTAHRKR